MQAITTDSVWRTRWEEIENEFDALILPEHDEGIEQDEEWCDVVVKGKKRRIRFHDYAEVLQISGLYEELFYEQLQCCSPNYVAQLLESVVREYEENPAELRVLDVGAGNGMVGDELQEIGVQSVIGIDIIPEAKEATLRDRPGVYDGFYVADLTDLPEVKEENIRRAEPNCLTTVAALGFGDIPPLAFAKALDLIATPGWMAFNLKEDFLREQDTSGFSRLIRRLNREGYIQTLCYRRYRHRLSIDGNPLHYVAVITKKLKDLDSQLLDSLREE